MSQVRNRERVIKKGPEKCYNRLLPFTVNPVLQESRTTVKGVSGHFGDRSNEYVSTDHPKGRPPRDFERQTLLTQDTRLLKSRLGYQPTTFHTHVFDDSFNRKFHSEVFILKVIYEKKSAFYFFYKNKQILINNSMCLSSPVASVFFIQQILGIS